VEREVAVGVTRHARAFAASPPADANGCHSLQHTIGCRMTVHAARVREHLGLCVKSSPIRDLTSTLMLASVEIRLVVHWAEF
jgi:hypothetical protein